MNDLIKLRRKILFLQLLLIWVFFSTNIFAQTPEKCFKYSGFSGGMMLHLGYVQSKNFTLTGADNFSKQLKLSGLAWGIGGQVRLHFRNNWRVGTEGYVTEHKYSNNSYISVGWGGILADYIWNLGKFMPFAGCTFGGGSQKNVTILEAIDNDFVLEKNNVSFRKFGFLCMAPFVGTEIALNKKIHLMLKVDYITNFSNPQPDFVTGPRFYFGFMFCR
jgi:hypothetical protein